MCVQGHNGRASDEIGEFPLFDSFDGRTTASKRFPADFHCINVNAAIGFLLLTRFIYVAVFSYR